MFKNIAKAMDNVLQFFTLKAAVLFQNLIITLFFKKRQSAVENCKYLAEIANFLLKIFC
jgi:hypothetical protein